MNIIVDNRIRLVYYKLEDKKVCETLLSELGEKAVLIRHDVDNVYGIYKPSRFHRFVKVANYSFLLLLSVTPKIRYFVPFYEEHLPELLDIEKTYGARGTYFFRKVTVPKESLLRELKSKGHELAYHSDRNETYQEWYSDLVYLEQAMNTSIRGYTKHGYSIVRNGGPWDEKKFIEYAAKARLKYLGQGYGHDEWVVPHKIKGVWYFGHHITLKKTPMNRVKEYLQRCLPLILIHPEDIYIKGEREKLDYILSKKKGIPLNMIVNLMEKLVREKQDV